MRLTLSRFDGLRKERPFFDYPWTIRFDGEAGEINLRESSLTGCGRGSVSRQKDSTPTPVKRFNVVARPVAVVDRTGSVRCQIV